MITNIFTAIAAGLWAIFNGISFGVIGTIGIAKMIEQILQGIM